PAPIPEEAPVTTAVPLAVAIVDRLLVWSVSGSLARRTTWTGGGGHTGAVIDLRIDDALLVDGTGAPPRPADVHVDGGRIVGVEPPGRDRPAARRALAADGRLVTPGFVDVHTHYDAQATWDPYVTPSSWHEIGRAHA